MEVEQNGQVVQEVKHDDEEKEKHVVVVEEQKEQEGHKVKV